MDNRNVVTEQQMSANEPFSARYLRLSGILSIIGLLVDGVSLLSSHPLAHYL
jgi:hypothetical protein